MLTGRSRLFCGSIKVVSPFIRIEHPKMGNGWAGLRLFETCRLSPEKCGSGARRMGTSTWTGTRVGDPPACTSSSEPFGLVSKADIEVSVGKGNRQGSNIWRQVTRILKPADLSNWLWDRSEICRYMVREERFITDQEAQEWNYKDRLRVIVCCSKSWHPIYGRDPNLRGSGRLCGLLPGSLLVARKSTGSKKNPILQASYE